MAHPYPSSPYYGGYSGPPFYPPQLQYPPQQVMPTASGFQPPTLPYPPVGQPPYSNPPRFDTNQQIPSPGTLPPLAPSAFNPDLFRQFSSSNVPPPPPLPPPTHLPLYTRNGMFPQYPQLLPKSNMPHLPPTTPSAPNLPRTSEAGPQSETRETTSRLEQDMAGDDPPPFQKSRSSAEGELSDGEIGEGTSTSGNFAQDDGAVALLGEKHRGHQSQMSRIKRPGAKPITGQAPSGPLLPNGEDDREGSSSSYNPPSASTPDEGRDALQDLMKPNSPSGLVQNLLPSLDIESSTKAKELAKQALKSLALYKITYSQMLDEGVDAQVLQGLYAELNIKIRGSPSITPKAQLRTATGEVSSEQLRDGVFSNQTSFASENQPTLPSTVPPESEPTRLNTSASLTKSILPSAVDQMRKSPAQPSASSSLERKDRIAQLLAAKTGKILGGRKTPDTVMTMAHANATEGDRSAVGQLFGKEVHQPSSAASATEMDSSNRITAMSVDPKNRLPTDLVKQKLAALKEASAKTQINAGLPTSATDRLQPPSETSTQVSAPQAENLGPKPLTLTPSDSELSVALEQPLYFDELNKDSSALIKEQDNFPFTIPGLFMTAAEADPEDHPARTGALGRGPRWILQDTSSNFQPYKLNATVYSSREHVLEPSDLAAMETPQVSKHRLTTESSDAIRPSPARPLFMTESSVSMTNELPSHESEEISEGEIMDIEPAPLVAESMTENEISRNQSNYSQGPPSQPIMSTQGGFVEIDVKPDSAQTASIKQDLHSSSHDSSWQAKNKQMEVTRKKNTEMEERQKLKRRLSQVDSLSSSTPRSPSVAKAIPLPQGTSSPPNQILSHASQDVPPDTMPQELSPQAESVATGNVSTQESYTATAAQLRAEFLRQRLLRQRMLREGLPDLETEIQKTRSRLAEKQAEIARIKAEAERREAETLAARQREEELLREMYRLEEQLQQGVKGRKQYSAEYKTLNLQSEPDSQTQVLENDQQQLAESTMTGDAGKATLHTEQPDQVHRHISRDARTSFSASSKAAESDEVIQDDQTSRRTPQSVTDRASLPANSDSESQKHFSMVERESNPASSLNLNPADHNPDFPYPDSRRGESQDDSRSRSNNYSSMRSGSMDVDNQSAGSASMSDSMSEDYDPDETTMNDAKSVTEESDGYDPEELLSPSIKARLDEDVDEYEPAEIVPNVGKLDSHPPHPLSPPVPNLASESSAPADDREDGVLLTEPNVLTKSQRLLNSVKEYGSEEASLNSFTQSWGLIRQTEPDHTSRISRFTPYRSPLSALKSFRFNPIYKDVVKDGYRSLTYSYNIDPRDPLCPTELAGDICTDTTCELQHFGQMTLADAKILEQLASANDIADQAERDQFVVGLKLVIGDLRSRGVKDFAEVANELASYRRRFREHLDPALVANSL